MPNPPGSQTAPLIEKETVRQALDDQSPASQRRRRFRPDVCDVFKAGRTGLETDERFVFDIHREAARKLPDLIHARVLRVSGGQNLGEAHAREFSKKRRIGIVFSGGPAPGGHNVIAGLFDAAKKANPESEVYGFILGPDGVMDGRAVLLDEKTIDAHRNMGGFSMIQTGRAKIDTPEKTAMAKKTCRDMGLDALVVVGGDDSNTNAAFLAQHMLADGVQVIGVPKTIDGDVQAKDSKGEVLCAMSFGFHSAARAFSESVSRLCSDCASDAKYWHVCKVMGRSASHLALETALQTHAPITLIGEDIAEYTDLEREKKAREKNAIDPSAYGMTLRRLSRVICDAIVRRAGAGKNYGVMVIPEGVLEFVNEIQTFIIKLNAIIGEYNRVRDTAFHDDFPLLKDKLERLARMARRAREKNEPSVWNSRDDDLFNDLPAFFQEGLLSQRDSHGNFQFSLVETEKVIMGLVKDYLEILKEKGVYKIGIERRIYEKTLEKDGLSPDYFGPALFKNYNSQDPLRVKESIISLKTLKSALEKEGSLKPGEDIPPAVKKIYEKSVPGFKTQPHFYGYDGRGADPTLFDCVYAHNLGLTAFSLIANGATGHMAAIKNLERGFAHWEPLGVPIAPLMHLEERKGKLSLVMEKSLVDLKSPAFQAVKARREEWLAARPGPDPHRKPGPIRLSWEDDEDRPLTLILNGNS
ncbi:Phosphofructokinase [Candidatus Desulfarcum epimagneticum]|uniref:Phosphofructokinase n=1 Tax=uncultured Desulfobacteraceae bacterium TaxID=218296 RepID=A0A484HLQ5_9BACT|nr:Phosphofructokinase [uncultured Desulfobacteraceae bacterium]